MSPAHAAPGVPAPQVIGRYALFEEIAFGGMATVHLGRLAGSAGFSRTIAIKRLHPQFAKDPEFVAMFLDEARLASRVQHPNAVATLDVVADSGEVFLVMEYVSGEALSKLWRNSKEYDKQIPAEIAASIICDLLNGLHAAHEAKSETGEPLSIVHRDVSPQNVLVGRDGIARVLDFGVAKAALRAQSTREGQVKGKLGYMSPEQINGKGVDRRADIFAAGVIAWETLCGRRLFMGDDAGELISKLLTGEIEPPNRVLEEAGKQKVPEAVNDAVLKALQRDPAERFATARDFAIALEAAIVVSPPHRVGEWVQELAGPELDARMRKVAQIERYSFELHHEFTPNPVSVGQLPATRVGDDATQKDVHGVRPPAVPSVAPDFRPGNRRKLGVVVGLLVLGLVLLVVGNYDDDPPPEISVERVPSKVETTLPTPEEPPPAATQDPPPEVEPAAVAPSATASAVAPTASAVRAAPPVTRTVSPKRPAKRADPCTPPWRIDERGIRRLKPGCY